MITSNELARLPEAKGVGNVSGRNVNESHLDRARGSSVHFGTGVREEVSVVRDEQAGRRPVVIEPTLCRAGREVPSVVHLVLSLALLFFAVTASML